jgi:hypothetical protein
MSGANSIYPGGVPVELGWVAMFDYNCLDPEDSIYQTQLAALKSQLLPDQKYLMVPKGFLYFTEHDVPEWKLGAGVLEYAVYCKGDDQCLGLMVFRWRTVQYSGVDGTGLWGTSDMPPAWSWDAQASQLLLSGN